MMAVGYGKVKVRFLKPRAATFADRSVGDVIFPLTVSWDGCAGRTSASRWGSNTRERRTARAALHVVAGTLLIAVLVLKIIVVRWRKGLDWYLPHPRTHVFALFALTWVTSAGDYLAGG